MALRVGLMLAVLSFPVWFLVPVAAWLAPTPSQKTAAGFALYLLAEVLFYGGLGLAGREGWATAKAFGWRALPSELLYVLRYGRFRTLSSDTE